MLVDSYRFGGGFLGDWEIFGAGGIGSDGSGADGAGWGSALGLPALAMTGVAARCVFINGVGGTQRQWPAASKFTIRIS